MRSRRTSGLPVRGAVRLVAVLAALCGSAALADLFCLADFGFDPAVDRHVLGVPDISQTNARLPGGGGAYCGPTAVGDWTWWLSRNGYPELVNAGWDPIDLVSRLGSGTYMNTSVTGGTSAQDLRDGWFEYLDFAYPGCFTVTYRGLDNEDECMPFDKVDDFLFFQFALGNYPVVRVGYYDEATGARCGGHYMAVVGHTRDARGDLSLELKDPSMNQDSTDSYRLDERVLGGVTRVKLVGRTRTKKCSTNGPTLVLPNYLDGVAVAAKRRALVWDSNEGKLVLIDLCEPERVLVRETALPVRHAVFYSDSWTILGTAQGGSNVVRFDVFSDQASVFATPQSGLATPGALVIDRRGHVWVANDNPSSPWSVVELDPDGAFVQGISRSQLAAAADLALDPARDAVYAIDPIGQQIARIAGSPPCTFAISPVAGDIHLAVLPDGNLVWNSDADPAIHLGLVDLANPCGFVETGFTSPLLSDPSGLFTDHAGQIWVSDPAAANIFVYDPQGMLVRSLDGWPTDFARLLGPTEPFYTDRFAPYPGTTSTSTPRGRSG